MVPIYHDPKTGNWDLLGVGFPYPPTGRPNWDKRKAAVGAVIRPGQDLNMVFGVTRTTSVSAGGSPGADVVYIANGSTFTWH